MEKHLKNILIKAPNWIGDAVMSTPVFKDLREYFPEAKITLLAQSNIAPLFYSDPNLSEVISYKKPSGWIHRAEHKDVILPLQLGEYDLGLLLTNSFTSAWWLWRGGVKNRIGFATNLRSWLLNVAVPVPKTLQHDHLVLTYKRLLEPLGIPLSSTEPALYLNDEDKAFAEQFLHLNHVNQDDIIVGINPGAAYGSAKCWLPDRFKEISYKLLENPRVVILYFGDPQTAPLVRDICMNLPPRAINLAGKTTLRELMALIAKCSMFLTNDSGPMHMASALKIPLLALFGSTNEVKTGPYGGGEVLHKHVACSPCYKRECPVVGFPCMTKITAEEVYQKLFNMIQLWDTK